MAKVTTGSHQAAESRRFDIGNDIRNSLVLALLARGEGWHNEHHLYPASVRQGFAWWEIDMTYHLLRLLSFTGLIGDLRPVPAHVPDKPGDSEARP